MQESRGVVLGDPTCRLTFAAVLVREDGGQENGGQKWVRYLVQVRAYDMQREDCGIGRTEKAPE